MTTEMNQHGLSRHIPEDVRRAVRQRCGFGCVRCGLAVIQYDHFDPEFVDATVHAPNGIVLLCGSCHQMRTSGLLSKETVSQMSNNPKCRTEGFSFGAFDIGTEPPEVTIGVVKAKEVGMLLRIGGDDVLKISPPSSQGEPFLIDAAFRGVDGNPTLEIVANEWRSDSHNWDVVAEGRLITIRKGLGQLVLQIRSEPPHRLSIARLQMVHKGWTIDCVEGRPAKFSNQTGTSWEAAGWEIEKWDVGIDLGDHGIIVGSGARPGGIIRGRGLTLTGSGGMGAVH